MQAHSPKVLVLYIWLWTQETMRKVFPYIGTLPTLGSLLPKGIWAQLNHHPPHEGEASWPGQEPGAGFTGRTERVEKSPQEPSCDLVFGDTKEAGCSCVFWYAFWWVINLRGSGMGTG